MVDYYRYRMTKAVKKLDQDLYCDKFLGGYAIFRKHKAWGIPVIHDGLSIRPVIDQPQMIMPLTDTWGIKGSPVEWGEVPVAFRLREIDGWNNSEHFTSRWEKEYEKSQASKDRKRQNDSEAFLKDFRHQFAKTFNEVNTSGVTKIDRRFSDDKYKLK